MECGLGAKGQTEGHRRQAQRGSHGGVERTCLRARFADLGTDVPPRDQQTPEWLGILQKAEAAKWWPIIKAANIRGE
jgi:hypothetical protein